MQNCIFTALLHKDNDLVFVFFYYIFYLQNCNIMQKELNEPFPFQGASLHYELTGHSMGVLSHTDTWFFVFFHLKKCEEPSSFYKLFV